MKNEINEAYEADKNSEKEKRKLVVPGETIVEGEDFLPGDNTRREGNAIVANKFGLAEEAGRVIKIISIFGAFIPRKNNVVIGRIVDVTRSGWLVDVDSAIQGFLSVAECPRFIAKDELNDFLDIGDVIAAKIWSVKGKSLELSIKGRGLGKLEDGFIFRIVPSRVPRVIGREGSMVSMIKEKTNCNVTVGQNGWIWIKGDSIDKENKARKAIEMIAEKVCIGGLTEKMEEWFEQND